MKFVDQLYIALSALKQSPAMVFINSVSFALAFSIPAFVFGISGGMKAQVADLGSEESNRKLSVFAGGIGESEYVPIVEDISRLLNSNVTFDAIGGWIVWPERSISWAGRETRVNIFGVTDFALIASGQIVPERTPDWQQLVPLDSTECLLSESVLLELAITTAPQMIEFESVTCSVVGVIPDEEYLDSNRASIYVPLTRGVLLLGARRGGARPIASLSSGAGNIELSRLIILFGSNDELRRQIVNVKMILSKGRHDRGSVTDAQIAASRFDHEKYGATLENLDRFLFTVMFLVVSFITAVIGLNTFYSIRMRTGDLAVQIALGARPTDLAIATLLETALCLVVGAMVGATLALSLVASFTSSPQFRVLIDTNVLVRSAMVVSFAGLAASALPAFVVSNMNPSDLLKRVG